MFFKFITLWFAIHCMFIHTVSAVECLFTEEDNYNCRFGKVTPYRFIANYNDSQLNYPGCTEKKIWLVIRHGTCDPAGGLPTVGMIETLPEIQQKIIEHYLKNESLVSANIINDLVKWRPGLVIDDVKNDRKLRAEGGRELVDIAQRFQSRFPTLFPEIYNNETFKFKYTSSQRTEESAANFTFGLFGYPAYQDVWYYPIEDGDVDLRGYKRCDRWQSEVTDNPAASEEIDLFVRSQIVNETLEEISNLLGFTIDYDVAKVIHSTCAYETSWSLTANSPWCKFLSLDNFKVFEYASDLEAFWMNGHGFNITGEISCPAISDMFQFFESVTERKAITYFSHSGLMLKLLSLMGLARDATPLTHDSFEFHRDDRAWRTSLIDSFAANIGFILYECEESGPSILVLHQERVVQIPGCPENSLCPLSVFEKLYWQSIHECDFEELCKIRIP